MLITADALHTQRGHASYLHGRGAHCLLTVKADRPSLLRQLRALPGPTCRLPTRPPIRHTLNGMQAAQTKTYLAHHLKLAGRSDPLFSDDAADLIYQISRGLPRALSKLAIQALIAGFATSKRIVDEASARAAVTEVTTD